MIAGALTLVVAAAFLVYAIQVAGLGSVQGGTYPLTASFRSAEGVGPGTDVRLAGVKIGSVTELDLNLETYRADMTVTVRQDVDVPEDSSIAISSEGLLGGNYVEIIPGGSPFNLAEGDAFTDTQGALSLLGLLAKFISASSGD